MEFVLKYLNIVHSKAFVFAFGRTFTETEKKEYFLSNVLGDVIEVEGPAFAESITEGDIRWLKSNKNKWILCAIQLKDLYYCRRR